MATTSATVNVTMDGTVEITTDMLQDLVANVTISSNMTEPPAEGLTLVAKVTISLMFIGMFVIVSGNLLVLIAHFSFSTLRDITSIFIANLAVADLITGLCHPFQIVFFFYPALERIKHACILRYTVISFACNASIFSLACTVIDRYIAITYPLKYSQIMTERKVYVMIAVIWVVDAVYCSLPSLGLNNFDKSPFCLYEMVIAPEFRRASSIIGVLFAVFMFVVYTRIFIIARGHAKRIQAEESQQGIRPSAGKQQSYVITALIVLFFQISWLPFFLVQLSMYEPSSVTQLKVIIANFCVFLGILNSTVNPIIYAWKNRQYRRAFVRILRLNLQDDLGQSSITA